MLCCESVWRVVSRLSLTSTCSATATTCTEVSYFRERVWRVVSRLSLTSTCSATATICTEVSYLGSTLQATKTRQAIREKEHTREQEHTATALSPNKKWSVFPYLQIATAPDPEHCSNRPCHHRTPCTLAHRQTF